MSVQNLRIREAVGDCTKTLIDIHFQHFSIIMANIGIEKMLICTTFEGGGSEKVYVLYICENADIFGWPFIASL